MLLLCFLLMMMLAVVVLSGVARYRLAAVALRMMAVVVGRRMRRPQRRRPRRRYLHCRGVRRGHEVVVVVVLGSRWPFCSCSFLSCMRLRNLECHMSVCLAIVGNLRRQTWVVVAVKVGFPTSNASNRVVKSC